MTSQQKEAEIEMAWTKYGPRSWWGHKLDKIRRLRKKLCESQNWRCCYCGIRLSETPFQKDSATIEHVVPRKWGGSNKEDNLVIACGECNVRRADNFWPVHHELLTLYENGEIA